MKCKIINLVESFIADVAFILLFSAMSQFMVLVVPLLMKSFPAELACERLVVHVYAHMCI